ncbi:MAG: hypothetical protein LQ347_000472 [Umbilicaria vellea]|nr:MAG: hypothetical protein LQ347_000472 [Umbilicaria vellea]
MPAESQPMDTERLAIREVTEPQFTKITQVTTFRSHEEELSGMSKAVRLVENSAVAINRTPLVSLDDEQSRIALRDL